MQCCTPCTTVQAAAQVRAEDLEMNLKDSLEHYLECADDPDFVEARRGLPQRRRHPAAAVPRQDALCLLAKAYAGWPAPCSSFWLRAGLH